MTNGFLQLESTINSRQTPQFYLYIYTGVPELAPQRKKGALGRIY
jgi:hypothetical protein